MVHVVTRPATPWHRQQWVKDGPPYPDGDGGGLLQPWRCVHCGERRELFTWVTRPRTYWHGRRDGWHR